MMTMINTAKEGLQDQLRKNDAVREEERDVAAEDVESIPSNHNSDSESSGTLSKPASSSSKESTLSAKHTDDNEESPLKNHILDHGHPKKVLDTIKKLYFSCNGSNNIEQLYILPSRWLPLLKFDKIGDAMHENVQNASCKPIQFFVEKNLDSWHPKTHGPRNYLQSFYLDALIHKCGGK